ncbi:MAG: FAD-dependent oxidoreductase [Albidovulum sp.]|nr:FAD-dependent oxidoreductase [Albidovulum sp.]
MDEHARVVVVGGGIAGCSTLYHLTTEGWNDAVLLERDELTSGTTWHSAAQVTNFGTNQTMIGLKSYSIRLYKELSQDAEYPVGYNFGDGGIRLAGNRNHMDGYAHFASVAKAVGVEFEVIDAAECRRRHPLLNVDGLAGGLWDPQDGHIDPAQLCQALARRSRRAGARIIRKCPVVALDQKPDGGWVVHTPDGKVACEFIVLACGYRVNEVASMMQAELPVVSMEHQYFVTDSIERIAASDRRMPLIRCPVSDFYCRQEKDGLLVGFYEQGCKTWGMEGIDPNFSNALCADDLERVADVMDGALERLPDLLEAGIRTVVNGPITYTADGLPLVGKIPGTRNAYCIAGLRAGVGEGGGHGWLLAQLIVHGEACYDTWCLDPRRFGKYASLNYCAAKAREDYQNEFRFHMPHEHRPAGRPARLTELTRQLDAEGAEFAAINGWERAAYFKPRRDFKEVHSFSFSNAHAIVRDEVLNVRDNAGIMEVSGFNLYEFSGRGVHDWLDRIACSRIPREEGRVSLCYFLNRQGNVVCEATVASIGEKVRYCSAAAAELHDFEWLSSQLPSDGSIALRSLTSDIQVIVVAGPNSKEILDRAADGEAPSAAFPWLRAKTVRFRDVSAIVYSLSYSGEVAYEIHSPSTSHREIWRILKEAGEFRRLRPFGLYATESMRIEKSYRHWKSDLITEFNPVESRLERFIDFNKDFVGRRALERMVEDGPRRLFAMLEIDCANAPAQPGSSIDRDGRAIGAVTSADFGFRTGKNLAMGFVNPECAAVGMMLETPILGIPRTARVVPFCPYDPDNSRLLY